jgi:hypothetical protein
MRLALPDPRDKLLMQKVELYLTTREESLLASSFYDFNNSETKMPNSFVIQKLEWAKRKTLA